MNDWNDMHDMDGARGSGPAAEGVPRDEGGFALVVALLSLVGITLLASAGYLLSNADYRINQSHRASVQAFYVASAGLEEYLGAGKVQADTVTYTHPEGSADVWATRLLDVDAESTLYRIESRGVHSPPEGGSSTRTMSKVAIFHAAPFNLNAAFTSPPGLQKNGVAGSLSGNDSADPEECGLAGPQDVAGLAVPPGGLSMSGGGGGGTPPGFSGEPPVDESMTSEELLAATGIDWAAVRSGAYATADYVYSQDGWPSFGALLEDEYPLIIVDQESFSVSPTQSGRGTLVVHGDLVVNGAWSWDGIILVGDRFVSNGLNIIRGAAVSGLDMLLDGEEVEESQLGDGTWDYRYHSCNVIWALKGLGSLAEEPGTWAEAI